MNFSPDNVEVLVRDYRDAAVKADTTQNSRPQHSWFHRLHRTYKALRGTEQGRRRLVELLDDGDVSVRCWAAAHSLEYAPDRARTILEGIRDDNGPCSISAKYTLKEYDDGRLTFDFDRLTSSSIESSWEREISGKSSLRCKRALEYFRRAA